MSKKELRQAAQDVDRYTSIDDEPLPRDYYTENLRWDDEYKVDGFRKLYDIYVTGNIRSKQYKLLKSADRLLRNYFNKHRGLADTMDKIQMITRNYEMKYRNIEYGSDEDLQEIL